MRVLISDNLGQIGVTMLEQEEGIKVDVKTGLSPDELKKIITYLRSISPVPQTPPN